MFNFTRELTSKEKKHIAQAISHLSKVTAKSNEYDALIECLISLIK